MCYPTGRHAYLGKITLYTVYTTTVTCNADHMAAEYGIRHCAVRSMSIVNTLELLATVGQLIAIDNARYV